MIKRLVPELKVRSDAHLKVLGEDAFALTWGAELVYVLNNFIC